jgi:hypothetical protein
VGTAGEPLYGIAPFAAGSISQAISTPGNMHTATIDVNGEIQYTALLWPYNYDPNHTTPDPFFRPQFANSIVYGGFGTAAIHAGAGESAILGGEAPIESYTNQYDLNGNQLNTAPLRSDWYHPYNPGNPLGYNPATTKFALYDPADPQRKILLDATGKLDKTMTGKPWILDFNSNEGFLNTYWTAGTTGFDPVRIQGNNTIFGDVGNKWLMGGNGRNRVWGGWGNTILDIRGTLDFNGGLNDGPVPQPAWESLAFGGAGRDVLLASSGGDRLIDWTGNFNTFVVPFDPFGMATVSRNISPGTQAFLLQLSKSDGADQTLGIRFGGTAARQGEPFGELGEVIQTDAAWGQQHGGPRDHIFHTHAHRDVLRTAGTKAIESPGTTVFIDPPYTGAPINTTTTTTTTTSTTATTTTTVVAPALDPAAYPLLVNLQMPGWVGLANRYAYTIPVSGLPGSLASVTLSDGTLTVTGTATLDVNGNASVTLDLSGLADGPLTTSVALTDTMGVSTDPVTGALHKKTVAPRAPSITLLDDTGVSASDWITNVAAPRIAITAEAGTVATIWLNSVVYTGQTLADGKYTVLASVMDAAGNVSPFGTVSVPLVIDTTPPTGSFLIAGSKLINGVLTTNIRNLALQLQFADAGSGLALDEVSIDGGATYTTLESYSGYTAATLAADGTYWITLRVTDVAGNRYVVKQSLLLDTSGATITDTLTAPTNNGAYDVGQNVTFTYSTSDAVAVTSISAVLDSTTGLASGAVFSTDTLTAGTHSIVVTATDALGNKTTTTITIQVHATAGGLVNALNDGVKNGQVTCNINNMVTKLQAAQAAYARGDKATAKGLLYTFLNQLSSQTGKGVTSAYASMLVNWTNDLIARS